MEDIFNYYSRVNFSENEIEEVLNNVEDNIELGTYYL